jgi:hypothetical protein
MRGYWRCRTGCSMRSSWWGMIVGGSERRRSCGGVQDQWVDRGIERGIVVQWCCAVLLLLLLCQSEAVRWRVVVFGPCLLLLRFGVAWLQASVPWSRSLFQSHPSLSRLDTNTMEITGYRNRHMIRRMAPRAIIFSLPNQHRYLPPILQPHLHSTCLPSTRIYSQVT